MERLRRHQGADSIAGRRTALYVRVSKKDSSQDVENQLVALRKHCRQQGLRIVAIYEDHDSGRKSRDHRTGFRQVFTDAREGCFDVVLVWSIDRLSREGIARTLMYIYELEELGVQFYSYREPYLNEGGSPIRELLIAISAYAAAHEASQLSARTKAGLEIARRRGKRLGRPRIIDRKAPRIDLLYDSGITRPEEIARRVRGISASSVRRYLQQRG